MLFVVATPIGNLEDITFRAVRTLKECELIACEDTRHTRHLLDHYGVTTPLTSYHEHNEVEKAVELTERMRAGVKVAIVSDAGTPLISDPGYRLIQSALKAGFVVVPIPGACAAVTALSAAGLPTDAFRFCGFLPARQGRRREFLGSLKHDDATLIFYEAPHRILDALEDIEFALPGRPLALARELTKLHEEFLRGTPGELRSILEKRESVRGEFTVLIGKGEAAEVADNRPLAEAVAELERAGVSRMDAIKQVARDRKLSKRDVYRELSS